MLKSKFLMLSMVMILAVGALAGCTSKTAEPATPGTPETAALSGAVQVDGSSTVFPISEAMAEEFTIENPDVQVTVAVSGTGGGFKRFIIGETDISNASRPIKTEEADTAKTNGIEYAELKVAIDGLTVVINPANDWAADMTIADLNKIWKKDGSVTKWSDVNPAWPAETIKLYSPGTDSGTFDYFVEEVLGKDEIRTDFTASEDDNVLVQGVAGDKYALGYFGYSYFKENESILKAVAIEGITPSDTTIADGSYSPLSRPLFIYVNKASYADKPQVKAFVDYTLTFAPDLIPSTGYIALSADEYTTEMQKLK
jgi:phosphate transport system substrate-binding protein